MNAALVMLQAPAATAGWVVGCRSYPGRREAGFSTAWEVTGTAHPDYLPSVRLSL